MPFLMNNVGIWVLVVSVWLTLFCLLGLLLAAFSDPGIYPRAELDPLFDTKRNTFAKSPKPRKLTVENGSTIICKFCETCNIYRPPRCSHCSFCNNCVDSFDHHCPWIGNCIGRRNYRYFLVFVYGVLVNSLFTATMCATEIVLRCLQSRQTAGLQKFAEAMIANPMSLIVALLALCAFGGLCALSGFHSYLLCKNVTTNEELKNSYNNKANPFFRGRILYWIRAWFPPHWPRYVRFRELAVLPTTLSNTSTENSDSS